MIFLTAFAAGLLFGLGLIVSGMVDPAKVLNFLDILGNWDPSLAFVLGGALRSSGEIHRLSIPSGTKHVRMRVNLEDKEHQRYQIKLRTIDGAEVLCQQSLQPVSKAVFITIPTSKLSNGDYSLTLSGINSTGEAEEITKYFLRVTQK